MHGDAHEREHELELARPIDGPRDVAVVDGSTCWFCCDVATNGHGRDVDGLLVSPSREIIIMNIQQQQSSMHDDVSADIASEASMVASLAVAA